MELKRKLLLFAFVLSASLSVLFAASCNLQFGGSLVTVENESSETASTDTETGDTESGEGTDNGGCISVDTQTDTAIFIDSDDTESDNPDSGTGAYFDTGSDTDPETQPDTEPDTQTDSDTVDSNLCPKDMVYIPAGVTSSITKPFCMDKYEASKSDATAYSYGNNESVAMSVKGVLPWYVNPMNVNALHIFKDACGAAGKALCNSEQWFASCTGPSDYTYVYGNNFEVETCNNVATFCDDYCAENSIDKSLCNINTLNCGYYCGTGSSYNVCWEVKPTGHFADCTNDFGTRDINGNVWEIVTTDSADGYEIRGGAINCADPVNRFKCSFTAGWTSLYAGFRCCKYLN
ncbi:MAG: hypothetical protein JXR91_08505 [Deltaproteobacteria bacterium]|nr:hypothetical protein [Deltaproteobacteria bacterium]